MSEPGRSLVVHCLAAVLLGALGSCGDGPPSSVAYVSPSPCDDISDLFADPALAASVTSATCDGSRGTVAVPLDSLRALTAENAGITDLTGIGHLPALWALGLAGNAIADLGPLSSLTDLQYLDLESNRVVHTDSLAGLRHLEALILNGNDVETIQPLVGLPALRLLEIVANPLSDPGLSLAVSALQTRGVEVAVGRRATAAQCAEPSATLTGSYRIVEAADLEPFRRRDRCYEITGNLELVSLSGDDLLALGRLTRVGGALQVSSTGLRTLDGLENLRSVGVAVRLRRNAELASIDGLSGLREVGSLTISDNPLLPDLDALAQVIVIPGDVSVWSCRDLYSLSGLQSLTFVGGSLSVRLNPSIVDLGLHSLTTIRQALRITRNAALPSLNGLSGLRQVSGDVEIAENPSLRDVGAGIRLRGIGGSLRISGNSGLQRLDGLNDLFYVGGSLLITGNASLSRLGGLHRLSAVAGSLTIRDNPALEAFDAFGDQLHLGGDVTISGNPRLPSEVARALGDSLLAWGSGGTVVISGNSVAEP